MDGRVSFLSGEAKDSLGAFDERIPAVASVNPTQSQIAAVFEDEFGGVSTKVETSKEDKIRMAKAEADIKKNAGVSAKGTSMKGKSSSKAVTLAAATQADGHEAVAEAKVLVLLIDYPNLLNNEEEQPSARSYWTADFSKEHYQKMLFREEPYTTPEGVAASLTKVCGGNLAYNQGLVTWYLNDSNDNNLIAVHPGYGRLGVMDTTQYVYVNQGFGMSSQACITLAGESLVLAIAKEHGPNAGALS